MSMMKYGQATFEAMKEEMLRDASVYVMAEDLKKNGGIYGHYRGLGEAVGDPDRLIDAPISETAIVGSAVGAALAGMRPVVDLRFSNCFPIVMDEISNQAAKSRYMFGGQGACHMVIRCPDGIMKEQAAHHTDCLEAWMAHVPGLQVAVPSSPAEAKGLLKTAIRNNNPVIFLEHKLLFQQEASEVPDEEYLIPFGKANIVREGSDISIITYGIMVGRAQKAAEALAAEGISAEIVDLRTLSPWDKETVLASVRKTGHAVVVHEAVRTCGFGAEISATISEEAFDALKAPVVRIGGPFVPIPFNAMLEDMCRTTDKSVYDAVKKALGR